MISTDRHIILAAFVSVAVFGMPLWWLMDRTPPYTDYVGTITPENPRPGEFVTAEWKLKINRVCDGWVQRVIIDSQGVVCNYDKQPAIRRDQLYSQQVGGQADRLNRSFPLCSRASPGPARYRAYTCYTCNPLQRAFPGLFEICGYTPNIDFTIAPLSQ